MTRPAQPAPAAGPTGNPGPAADTATARQSGITSATSATSASSDTSDAPPGTAANREPNPAPHPDQQLAQVLQRLQASRLALRAELLPPPEPSDAEHAAGEGHGGGGFAGLAAPLKRLWRQLRRAGRQSPVLSVLAQAVQAGWRSHPWQPAVVLVSRRVQPVLRRHPVASVALAALAGAALVGLRAWRWPAMDRHLRPMPGRALQWLTGQLASAPMQTALLSLALLALRDDPPRPGQASHAHDAPHASDPTPDMRASP